MAVVAVVTLCVCQRKTPPVEQVSVAQSSPLDAAQEPLALVPAARCGECHGNMEREWRSSAHAQSDASPIYRAMRTASGGKHCDRCHAPLRALAVGDPVAAEGVTCDVCHTIASVQVDRADGTGFLPHPEDNLRYGPLCDTTPHYFHRMGCSLLHRESAFCAACHNWSIRTPGGTVLSILPEYTEWRDSESAMSSFECPVCHMPGVRTEAAVGSRERSRVANHSFVLRGTLLGRALSGQVQIKPEGGKLRISLMLTNSGAGHAVPTGLPERKLQVGVETLDAAGRVLSQEEHSYGRVMVDAADREVPFYAAVKEQMDTRIRAGETRKDSFLIDVPKSGQLRVYVRWRPISAALASQLQVVPPRDEPMLSASVALPLLFRRNGESVTLKLQP